MKRLTSLLLITFLSLSIFATNIPLDVASQVAKNVFYEHSNIKQSDILLKDAIIVFNDNTPLYYIFDVENYKGFVIISADDRMTPVLGFSTEGNYVFDNQPIQFVEWMQNYENQIVFIIENNVKATAQTIEEWNKYNCSADVFVADNSQKSVLPLLGNIMWNQDSGWNDYCPLASGGPGGRAYAGCVATAQGQVMKYWEHPVRGLGEHSYWTFSYGTLSANYGEQTYNWSSMADGYATDATALLLYHIGVSVDMQYAADGSGSYTSLCELSLENYFRYDTNATFVAKDDFSTIDWQNILMDELDYGRPIIYSGHSSEFGHAFVCDGYSSATSYHFNWGWSGDLNGYFSLTSVNGFNQDQKCVIGIEPNEHYVAENMELSLDGNDVTLTWDLPYSSSKNLTGFRVYRNEEVISNINNASTIEFTDNNVDDGEYTYYVTANYSDGESYPSNEEDVAITFANISELNSDFSVYPNPSNGIVNFTDIDYSFISVTDICGKTVYYQTGFSNNKINITNLNSGIYFINVRTNNEIITRKIIIQ